MDKSENKDDSRANRLAEREAHRERMRGNLMAAAAVILILVLGVYLFAQLRETVRMEECVMSGRKNCGRIDMPRD